MEMKEYMAPEMEVVELKYKMALLSASDGDANTDDDPEPAQGGNLF